MSNIKRKMVVLTRSVESEVDSVSGGVVVWPQRWLLVRPVADHEVHDGHGRLQTQTKKIYNTIHNFSQIPTFTAPG